MIVIYKLQDSGKPNRFPRGSFGFVAPHLHQIKLMIAFIHKLLTMYLGIMAKKKEDSHQFSVKFPKSLLEEIDQICTANYITRTAWIIKAAIEKLERERTKSAEDLIAKIASHEKQ